MKSKLKGPSTLVILFMSICIALALNVRAQDFSPIVFNEIEGPGGKPIGPIRGITQDTFGYIWIACESEKCIYRYDGKRLIPFRQDINDPNSLGGTAVSAIFADKKGLIWVGFSGEGLDRFDPVTNTFTHYRHDETNKK